MSDEGPADEERRREPRRTTHMEVDFAAEGNFLFAYITDISSMGIFIRTEDPLAVGTELELKFAPPADVAGMMNGQAHGPLELRGQVVWNTSSGGHSGNPGMGIKFVHVEPRQRSRLLELVRAIAYLDDRDGN